ncbi:hypothetical protein [Paenibacillus sp.]|jgi:hypothetical protein|uniref:hypothetical protein n=1 Tax=Paenibacillus sp. TaxID=58172 RepID=UPI002824654B|nr:hypothetical protein [Paenibacillus sp.]MDR0268022.1 hypothetical protein [Paenibacillus sp.]
MDNIVSFPNRNVKPARPLAELDQKIQDRFGVTLEEYVGFENGGKRTLEVQAKIDRAMQKETLKMASKF